MDIAKLAGIGLLAVGICLLIFTFYCAYLEYRNVGELSFSGTVWEVFTQALGPLIGACIRVMFLGVMGWAGVVLTNRGVQLLKLPTQARPSPPPQPSMPMTPPPPYSPEADYE